METGQRLGDGRIRVPARAESPEGLVGDGVVVLSPGDPGFAVWDAYLPRDDDPTS